jgi:hypothetical protein
MYNGLIELKLTLDFMDRFAQMFGFFAIKMKILVSYLMSNGLLSLINFDRFDLEE